jgi:hypothetical protein
MKYGSIAFSKMKEALGMSDEELSRLPEPFKPDHDCVVMMGIKIDTAAPESETKELEDSMNGFFGEESGFVTSGAKIKSVLRITGNVRGEAGSHDWLLVFDKDPAFNCARRPMDFIKWVSDYVDNYAAWYE